MKTSPLILCLASLFLLNCGVDGLSGTSKDASQYANASLVVDSPTSGEIYLIDDALLLKGKIVDKDGTPLDFIDIVWRTDQMETPIGVGTDEEVYLDIGIHSINATVELPNGDRLKETLGGIRIQSPLTGVYSGNANFDVTDFDGLTDMLGGFGGGNDSGEEPTTDEEGEEPTEEEGGEEGGIPGLDGIDLSQLTASCVGGLDFIVDMWGKVMDGGGECSINLMITDPFDLNYSIAGDITQNDAEGNVEISLGFLPIAFDWQGTFNNDRLHGEFEGDSFLFKLKGSLDARRLTRYVDMD
jgi:hypothetical protein